MFEEKPHHRSSPTALAASAAADSLIESVIESGQIGNRLAEEIHNLRSELLQIKQEKRLLIVANRNLQEENNKWIKLAQSNYNTIASDQEEILNQVITGVIVFIQSNIYLYNTICYILENRNFQISGETVYTRIKISIIN